MSLGAISGEKKTMPFEVLEDMSKTRLSGLNYMKKKLNITKSHDKNKAYGGRTGY